MPELRNRRLLERELIEELGIADMETRKEIIALLGEDVAAEGLPPQEWESIASRYQGILSGRLERIFLLGAVALALQIRSRTPSMAFEVGVDIQQRARAWATQYSADLAHDLNRTSRNRVQAAINAYRTGDIDRDVLTNIINNDVYNADRARLIAVTEITRANSEGEEQALEAAGMRAGMTPVWITSRDDRTCPICQPLEGRRYGDGWTALPPIHPGCRCYVDWIANG